MLKSLFLVLVLAVALSVGSVTTPVASAADTSQAGTTYEVAQEVAQTNEEQDSEPGEEADAGAAPEEDAAEDESEEGGIGGTIVLLLVVIALAVGGYFLYRKFGKGKH